MSNQDGPECALQAEERILGTGTLATHALVRPEPPELRHQRVRQEDVPRPAPFRDLGANPDAGPGRAVGKVNVADVKADDLGKAQAGAERQGVDDVVAGLSGRDGE